MRILHVAPFLGSVFGGTTTVVRSIASQLAKRHHDITVLTTDYKLDSSVVGLGEGFEVIPFRSRANLGLLVYSPEMKTWLSENVGVYDVVHMHTFRTYQNGIARNAALKFDVPYVLQAHGGVLPFHQKQLQKRIFDLAYGKRILMGSSRAIAVSRMEVKQYEKMGFPRDRIELIPNGINIGDYQQLPPRDLLHDRYGMDAEEKVILFLGRIDRIKGLDLLVDAYAQVCQVRKDCRLVIAGPDFGHLATLKERIRGLGVEDRVLFTGPLQGEVKFQAITGADLCVVPSTFDIFSMSALEAMASGTPVIITNRCGISDMISDVSLIVDYDVDQFRDAIIRMLEDDGLRRELSEAGRKRVEEVFDWSSIIDRLEAMYRSL